MVAAEFKDLLQKSDAIPRKTKCLLFADHSIRQISCDFLYFLFFLSTMLLLYVVDAIPMATLLTKS